MPETFSPIIWRNNQTPALSETNLNRLEQGVEVIDDRLHSVERGILTPVTVPYATSVVLDATKGAQFRCFADGDLTLDDVVGGVDGQVITFQVLASGASMTLSFTGSADPVDISLGSWWTATLRYIAPVDTWLLADGHVGNTGTAGPGSGSVDAYPSAYPAAYGGAIPVNPGGTPTAYTAAYPAIY